MVAVTQQTGGEDTVMMMVRNYLLVCRGRQKGHLAPTDLLATHRISMWPRTVWHCKHWSSERTTLGLAHTYKTAIAPQGPGGSRWGRCSSRQGSAPLASSRSWTFRSLNSRAHRPSWHSLTYPIKWFQNTTQHHKPGTITLWQNTHNCDGAAIVWVSWTPHGRRKEGIKRKLIFKNTWARQQWQHFIFHCVYSFYSCLLTNNSLYCIEMLNITKASVVLTFFFGCSQICACVHLWTVLLLSRNSPKTFSLMNHYLT